MAARVADGLGYSKRLALLTHLRRLLATVSRGTTYIDEEDALVNRTKNFFAVRNSPIASCVKSRLTPGISSNGGNPIERLRPFTHFVLEMNPVRLGPHLVENTTAVA